MPAIGNGGTSLLYDAKLAGGFEHGSDVFSRHVLLDIVHLAEDVTSFVGFEGVEIFTHVVADLLRGGLARHMLGIAATTPEYDASIVAVHEIRGRHVGGRYLHGFNSVNACIDPMLDIVVNQARSAAANTTASANWKFGKIIAH